MDKETIDVKETEESSTEETTEEISSEDLSSKKVPYVRLRDEREKRKALEEEVAALKEKEATLKATLSPEPEKEVRKEEASLTREEAILYAQQYDVDEVDRIKKIAEIEDISLTDATKSDMFVAWKEKRDADSQNQKAQLGVSFGSATQRDEGFDSGMSDDEHRALFNKKFSS